MEYKLRDLYKVANGLSKGGAFFGSGFPFISFSTVFNNFFVPDEINDFVQSTLKEQVTYSIKKGDILITRTSETIDELGMSCVALKDYPTATFNGFCKRLRPLTDKVYPHFIGYYLRTPYFRSNFKKIASLITRASLRNEDLLRFSIELPPIDKQKKIAEILYSYDNLIENNNKRIKLLEKMAENLYKEWFVRFRFPGYEDVTFENGIPKEWKKVKLDDVLNKIATGLNPRKNFVLGEGENFYVTIKNMADNTVYLDDKCDKVNDDAIIKINKRSDLKTGDLLFSGIGTIGRVCLIDIPTDNWNISESVFTMRANQKISSKFLYMLLLSQDAQNYCQSRANGSAQKGIRMGDLRKYTFLLPTKNIITNFTDQISPILRNVSLLRNENKNLIQQRDMLLPRLMSGKLEV